MEEHWHIDFATTCSGNPNCALFNSYVVIIITPPSAQGIAQKIPYYTRKTGDLQISTMYSYNIHIYTIYSIYIQTKRRLQWYIWQKRTRRKPYLFGGCCRRLTSAVASSVSAVALAAYLFARLALELRLAVGPSCWGWWWLGGWWEFVAIIVISVVVVIWRQLAAGSSIATRRSTSALGCCWRWCWWWRRWWCRFAIEFFGGFRLRIWWVRDAACLDLNI